METLKDSTIRENLENIVTILRNENDGIDTYLNTKKKQMMEEQMEKGLGIQSIPYPIHHRGACSGNTVCDGACRPPAWHDGLGATDNTVAAVPYNPATIAISRQHT